MLGGSGFAALLAICWMILGAALSRGWRRLRRADAPRALTAGWLVVGALALLSPLRLGAGGRSPAQGTVGAGPDLLLVTIDTLRADHVGVIGGARTAVQTPNLDALAAAGALFDRGVSPIPLTLPAHAALLSGQHPLDLGVLRNGTPVPTDAPLLAARLREAGWRTGAFVSSAILRARTGLSRGFERYDDRFDAIDRLSELGLLGPTLRWLDLVPRARRGDRTVDRALAWLAQGDGRPTFLWVHLYDPHAPYRPPEPWASAYPWDSPDAQGNPSELRATRDRIRARAELMPPFFAVDLRQAVALYAGEVSYADAQLGRLLAAIPPSTRVIVAADHGESLTEHHELLGHGSEVYDTTTRVPILLRGPEIPPGTRIDAPAPLERVAPTMLALAALDPGGPTLLDLLTPGAASEPPLISVAGVQQSQDAIAIKQGWEIGLCDRDTRWISGKGGELERYLPAEDPGELHDLAAEASPEEREAARRQADAVRARIEALDADRGPLDAETRDELRALGYSD